VTLVKAMKLGTHMESISVREHAMQVIECYVAKNQKVELDLRLILADHRAVDQFTKWRVVRKNFKDMSLVEPKNLRRSQASFRKCKSSISLFHEEEKVGNTSFLVLHKVKSDNNLEEVEGSSPSSKSVGFFRMKPTTDIEFQQNQALKGVRVQLLDSKIRNSLIPKGEARDSMPALFYTKQGYLYCEVEAPFDFDNLLVESTNPSALAQLFESTSMKVISAASSIPNIFQIRLGEEQQCDIIITSK